MALAAARSPGGPVPAERSGARWCTRGSCRMPTGWSFKMSVTSVIDSHHRRRPRRHRRHPLQPPVPSRHHHARPCRHGRSKLPDSATRRPCRGRCRQLAKSRDTDQPEHCPSRLMLGSGCLLTRPRLRPGRDRPRRAAASRLGHGQPTEPGKRTPHQLCSSTLHLLPRGIAEEHVEPTGFPEEDLRKAAPGSERGQDREARSERAWPSRALGDPFRVEVGWGRQHARAERRRRVEQQPRWFRSLECSSCRVLSGPCSLRSSTP